MPPSAEKCCEHLEMLECAQSSKTTQQSTAMNSEIREKIKSYPSFQLPTNHHYLHPLQGSSPSWLMIISSMDKRTELCISAPCTRAPMGEEGRRGSDIQPTFWYIKPYCNQGGKMSLGLPRNIIGLIYKEIFHPGKNSHCILGKKETLSKSVSCETPNFCLLLTDYLS